jgi:hypothetical protein
MDGHEQFSSEEYFRYTAECSRLARLARPPTAARSPINAAGAVQWRDWLDAQRRLLIPEQFQIRGSRIAAR